MIVEVQGHPFEIIADEKTDGIQIKQSKNGKIRVFVHPHIPQKELIAYLNKNIKQLKKPYDIPCSPTEDNMVIQLFGDNYPVLVDQNTHTAYIRGKVIHAHTVPKNKKQTERLKDQLLWAQTTQLVGMWEERLHFLLEEIVLKTLPKRLFIVYQDRSQIVFSRRLIDIPLDMLHLIVAKSIFAYLQLSDEQAETLSQKYIPNWKHLSRVFNYEQASR